MSQLDPNQLPPPLVPPERSLAEITIKGLILGMLLSMILAAANAYIGLLVGLTVSASIPAAAVSMGVLRLFPKSNILENNLVQTSASAGESLVSGIIFTIPALVLMGAWDTYHYWSLVGIAVMGGILGVAFTIPLRRALIVEARLKFPEGVATAEVLKTGGIETDHHTQHGEEAAAGFRRLLQAGAIGATFKILESGVGLLAGNVAKTAAFFKGKYAFMGDISLSPALVGVGYIVGLNIATLVFIGGAIGTLIGVPLYWALGSETIMTAVGIDPTTTFTDLTVDQWGLITNEAWGKCRRLGVGAMIVGGIWSLISLMKPLAAGMKASLHAYKTAKSGGGQEIPRTELDTPIHFVGIIAAIAMVPLFLLFYSVLEGFDNREALAAVMTVMMLFFGFIFSSVAGYMAGLVGSSNNPISGVTIATVIISALILSQLTKGQTLAATLGPITVIYLAGLICSSAAIAGDNMQDLKCGHILGATPWKQQIYQVVGVVAAAAVIPFVLRVLDAGRGIGRPIREGVEPLSAPQAGLMKDLASGIFGGTVAWNFIIMGMVLAVCLILLDEFQKRRGSHFRFPVLAVAVGIYLPLGLSIPIFAGGLLAHVVARRSANKSRKVLQTRENSGLLLASGLITGEALMGVLVAVAAVIFQDRMPDQMGVAPVLGILFLIGVMVYLYRQTMNAAK